MYLYLSLPHYPADTTTSPIKSPIRHYSCRVNALKIAIKKSNSHIMSYINSMKQSSNMQLNCGYLTIE